MAATPSRCASAALRIVTGRPARKFAAIGLMYAGDDLDQRRFAGPVLAEKGMNFAGVKGERDVSSA